MRSKLVLLQLALVGQACALLVAPRPCSWHAACREAGRRSSPCCRQRKGKASRGSSSTRRRYAAAGRRASGSGREAAMAQAEAAAAEAAAARRAGGRASQARRRGQQPRPHRWRGGTEPTPFVMAPPDALSRRGPGRRGRPRLVRREVRSLGRPKQALRRDHSRRSLQPRCPSARPRDRRRRASNLS